ncbi:trehalase isoform X2 [Peromyscus maniculatus bairdii]|uniref:trehalase isoform X2 n=1 Tax=Peromyscus maniculatus bairdii TaxID=230844 RepID=UPI003FD67535
MKHTSHLGWPHLMAWTLPDLGRQVKQAVPRKPEVPGLAHSVPATATVPRMTWELHLLLLLGLGLGSQEALPPPCERSTAMGSSFTKFRWQSSTKTTSTLWTCRWPRLQRRSCRDSASWPWHTTTVSPGNSFRSLSSVTSSLWDRSCSPGSQKTGQTALSSCKRSQMPSCVPGRRNCTRSGKSWERRDSYWVMEGLLLSEMASTVKGMLQNFLDLVKTYGHIPNGGRVYYLQRSQPPLLTLMMDLYVTHTQDVSFLQENIGTLASELDFWTVNRTVSVSSGGQSYALNRYYVPYGGPRPESYSKDEELANTVSEGDRETLWAELKAGAESGWDFSSRWLVGGPSPDLLSSIRTSKMVPVDLNAFLCQAEELMSHFYSRLGNDAQATKYRNLRSQRLAAMEAVLWDEQKGAWFDYDLEKGKKNLEFYPSNLTPLWAGCFSDPSVIDKALKYLEDNQILTYQNGIPTSLRNTGQQWDFPNAWAPLQDLVIRGLAKSASPRTQEVAFQLAQNWIRTNFKVYSQTSAMYEKYDMSNGGHPGGGGEYEVQEGFGWTNGVALVLLDRYGDQLTSGTQLASLGLHSLVAALLVSLLPW